MPSNNPSPIPAFFAQLDVRALSAVGLFSRSFNSVGTQTVTAPTFSAATPSTTGIYENWLEFLHGYASEPLNTLQADIDKGWTLTGAAGVLNITLESNDRVKLASPLQSFTIVASADNATFGYDTTAASATGAGPAYSLSAPNDWTRGTVQNKFITISNSGGSFFLPERTMWSQSVITMFRDRGNEGDADDSQTNTTTLEGMDNTAATATAVRPVRWFVTDDGRVGWSCPTNISNGAGIFNLDDTFREMIGWSGKETVTTTNGVDTQIGDYYATRCLVPTRPMERLNRDVLVEDTSERLRGGGIASNKMGAYDRIFIEAWIDGPSDSRDLHRHWLQNVAPYLTAGRKITVFFEWGDPRRGLESFKVTSTQDPYDLLYSTEKDGERARYRGQMDTGGSDFSVSWPQANRRRAPLSLNISKAAD
jgi:hypothetical protein